MCIPQMHWRIIFVSIRTVMEVRAQQRSCGAQDSLYAIQCVGWITSNISVFTPKNPYNRRNVEVFCTHSQKPSGSREMTRSFVEDHLKKWKKWLFCVCVTQWCALRNSKWKISDLINQICQKKKWEGENNDKYGGH